MSSFISASGENMEVVCSFWSINTIFFTLKRNSLHAKYSKDDFSNAKWLSLRKPSS